MLELNKLYCMDCMEGMRDFPDDYFDLAIVDPPYGIKMSKGFDGFGGFGGFGKPIHRRHYKDEWDNKRPDESYFNELLRVSKKQIIFGGNYFTDYLPVSRHWITWDKLNTMPTFGDCELLYTNGFKRNSVKKFVYEWNGLLGKEKDRFHPTQKPVQLYKWILHNYAKPERRQLTPYRIIDTHVGSGSSIIAFLDFNVNWVGFEIDKDYHKAATKRIENHKKQLKLF